MRIELFYFLVSLLGLAFFLISPIFPNQFPFQLGGGLVFWLGIGYLLLRFPLRSVVSCLRDRVTWGVFLAYLTVHYMAYSLLLDRILGISPPSVFSVTYAPMGSLNLENAIGLFFTPSLSLGGSWFYLDLSFFSLVMGLVIGLLVVGTLIELRRMTGLRRNLSIVSLPLLGIVSGSTCCISIATIVAYYTPVLALGTFSPFLDSVYVGLPVITALFLWINYGTTRRVGNALRETRPDSVRGRVKPSRAVALTR